jgi:hypothetical protein
MGLTMSQKQAVTKQMRHKYNKAGKKEKGEILDSLIEPAKYGRSYAYRTLSNSSKANILEESGGSNHELTL